VFDCAIVPVPLDCVAALGVDALGVDELEVCAMATPIMPAVAMVAAAPARNFN
jgi:hypothetical protein